MRRAREEFAALGQLVEAEQEAIDGLLEWADRGPWFIRRPWAPWAVVALTVCLLGLLGAQVTGDRSTAPGGCSPSPPPSACWWCSASGSSSTFTRVFTRAGALEHHAALFDRISGARFTSALLLGLQSELRASGLTAAREIARLARIEQFAELRRSALAAPAARAPRAVGLPRAGRPRTLAGPDGAGASALVRRARRVRRAGRPGGARARQPLVALPGDRRVGAHAGRARCRRIP